MAEPITWRNLANITINDAERPLEVAGRLFNSGLDKVAGVLTNQEAQNQKVADRADDAQVLAFQEALAKTTDPAQIAQIQGQLDAYRNSIQNSKVRASLLGKEEARQTQLQDILTKKAAFDDAATARREEPAVMAANAAILDGNYDAARAYLTGLTPKSQVAVLTKMDARQREEVMRGRQDLEFAWKGAQEAQNQLLRPLEIRQKNLSYALTSEQLAATKENRVTAAEQRAREKKAAEAKAAQEDLARRGNLYADGEYSPNRDQELRDLIKTMPGFGDNDPEAIAHVFKRLAKVAGGKEVTYINRETGKQEKVKVAVPMSLVKNAILQARDQPWRYNEGWAQTFENHLNNVLDKVDQIEVDGKTYADSPVARDYMSASAVWKKLNENTPVGSGNASGGKKK